MKRIFQCVSLLPVIALCITGSAGAELPVVGNEYLDMDLEQLMQVTVTSVAKRPQVLQDTAAAVFVITGEDIRRTGVSSIPEALAMAPGLQVARISSSKWSVSSRGFPGYASNKLLVLIDGRTVYSPAYSGTFWDMQHTLIEDVERIEVIRGPGGTVWGANAVNGVINIITRSAEDTRGGLVRVAVGDMEKSSTAGRYGFSLGEAAAGRVYLTYSDHNSNTLNQVSGLGEPDANDGWDLLQGGFRVDGNGYGHTQWSLHGDLYNNDEDQIVYPYWIDQPPYLSTKYGHVEAKGGNLLGRLQHTLADQGLLTAQAYYDYNKREEDIYNQTFNTLDLELQYETELGERNTLTIGAGYRQTDSDFDPTYQVVMQGRTDNLYSAFVQDEIRFFDDRFLLTLGTKYEYNDYTESEWQPSIRGLWKADEKHSLWASVARAVRTPSIAETNGRITVSSFPPLQVRLTGTEQFQSEDVIAYEAGYRWSVSSTLGIDLSVFYNDYNGLYELLPQLSPDGVDLVFHNEVDGAGYGLEAAVNWKPTADLDFVFTYSFLEFNLEDGSPLAFVDGQSYAANASPKHQASVRSSYRLTEQWRFNLWLRYSDSFTALNSADLYTNPIELDSYYLLDANLIWNPNENLEIMFSGKNLLEDGQLQYASELITPATDIERGFFAKLTWRF